MSMVGSLRSMPSGHHDAEEVSQALGAGAEPEPPCALRFGMALRYAPCPAKPKNLPPFRAKVGQFSTTVSGSNLDDR